VADLPADLGWAARHLAGAEASLADSRKALATAETRLDAFAARPGSDAGASFVAGGTEGALGRPERELERQLLALGGAEGAASYALGEGLSSELTRIGEQFQGFLERLEHQVAHSAWVETRSAGDLLARTVVSWMGGAETVWRSGLNPLQMALHQRTLALALASRQTLLRTVVVVGRYAGRLAKLPLLLSTPWGAVLVVPLLWRFIRDVRAEVESARAGR
jgi:hypothetical protein